MGRYLRTMTSTILAAVGRTGSTRYDIEWVDGYAAPRITAEPTSYRFETPGGRPVYYPSAYRRAFGRPVYISATKGTIRVGRGWAIRATIKQCA